MAIDRRSDKGAQTAAELRARVGKLEAEIRWMRPKPNESYTAWVERLFHAVPPVKEVA